MIERKIQLLDFVFSCQLRHEKTADYFHALPPDHDETAVAEVCVAQRDWKEIWAEGLADTPHTEYSVLTPYFSEALIPQQCVILHAVALRWQDMAYLICAQSGVGKSTQARWLQTLCPGEFGIICGDRPILSFHDNNITVHPSPWNGKENWHGAEAAPLAGLILLERGDENRLVALTEREAAIPMYQHFIQTGWDPEVIRRVADLETRLLNTAFIWKLTTHEVPASTELLLKTVFY